MNDDVAGIDQDPIAMRQALDTNARHAALFQLGAELLGNRADMAVRAAGRDDHVIGHRAFAGEVDGNRLFRLGVVKDFKNLVLQGFSKALLWRSPAGFGVGTGTGAVGAGFQDNWPRRWLRRKAVAFFNSVEPHMSTQCSSHGMIFMSNRYYRNRVKTI